MSCLCCSAQEWLHLSIYCLNKEYISVYQINSLVSWLFLTGWFEGCHLDRRLSDCCDVRRAAGCHRGGSAAGRRSVWSLEESPGRKPPLCSRVSPHCGFVGEWLASGIDREICTHMHHDLLLVYGNLCLFSISQCTGGQKVLKFAYICFLFSLSTFTINKYNLQFLSNIAAV